VDQAPLFPIPFDSTYHPAEAYYANIYFELITHQLSRLGRAPMRILEARCGAGRILVPIVQSGHIFVGADRHGDSIAPNP